MGALLTVAAVVVALLFGSAVPASGAAGDVPDREAALQRATAARVEAEARVERIRARADEVRAELEALGANAERLTEELASARRQMREYAVAAYIDGGQTEIMRASLSPEKAVALSWQSNIVAGQSVSADEAAERFEVLREANTPARLAAAAELDKVDAALEEAEFDAIQAAAHERDAEAALARAREAAERAAAERAAAQQAAEQRANEERRAAQAAARTAPAPRQANAPAPAAPAPAPAPAPGGMSAWESSTLAKIRRCESGGNYRAISPSGRYRGAYQFDTSTWRSVGGSGDPAAASPAEQDQRALILLRQRGTRPWPHCGR